MILHEVMNKRNAVLKHAVLYEVDDFCNLQCFCIDFYLVVTLVKKGQVYFEGVLPTISRDQNLVYSMLMTITGIVVPKMRILHTLRPSMM